MENARSAGESKETSTSEVRSDRSAGALASASGVARDFLQGDGPLAEATRQGLIDDEILRLHPLPASNLPD